MGDSLHYRCKDSYMDFQILTTIHDDLNHLQQIILNNLGKGGKIPKKLKISRYQNSSFIVDLSRIRNKIKNQ